jgi:hypothetical protein
MFFHSRQQVLFDLLFGNAPTDTHPPQSGTLAYNSIDKRKNSNYINAKELNMENKIILLPE